MIISVIDYSLRYVVSPFNSVVMDCKIYDDIRDRLFTEICGISFQFRNLPLDSQFLQIMSNPQFYRAASRTVHKLLHYIGVLRGRPRGPCPPPPLKMVKV